MSWNFAVPLGVIASILLAGCMETPANDPTDAAPGRAHPVRAPDPPLATQDGPRPHVHDYWGGATSLQLFQGNVPLYVAHNHLFDEPPREQHTHGCEEELASGSQGGSVKFSLPPPTTVIPGTDRLEFMFAWSDPAITGIRFLYKPANEHHYVDAGRVTNRQPVDVSVHPEMTDDGHATRTRWAFFLCADDGQDDPAVAQGTVTARIVARRAETLPLEPAHPDLWQGLARLRVANATWAGESLSALNKGDEAFFHVPLPGGSLVPFDTGRIELTAQMVADPDAPEVPHDVVLYHRDAATPDWEYERLSASDRDGGTFVFRIPVDETMTDSVYATESSWDFWVRLTSPTRGDAPAGAGHWSAPAYFKGSVHVDAFAVHYEAL